MNCYNGERYLREAIDSVVAQTYVDWELIIWDNQSTDGTASIVNSYHDERISYFYSPSHTGLGEARNLAIKKVHGEFLTFLDSDDLWINNFLEQGIRFLEHNNEYIGYYCNYIRFNSISSINYNSNESGSRDFKFLLRNYDIGMSGVIIKMHFKEKYNIAFCDKYSLIEDFDFFLRIAKHGLYFYESRPLFKYRMHNNSLTNTLKKGWSEELGNLYNELTTSVLTSNEIKEFQSELKWMKVRIINAKINERIERKKNVEVVLIILKHIFLSWKLMFPLISVLIGRKSYFRLLYFLNRKSYKFSETSNQ